MGRIKVALTLRVPHYKMGEGKLWSPSTFSLDLTPEKWFISTKEMQCLLHFRVPPPS